MDKKDLTICEDCLFYETGSKREYRPSIGLYDLPVWRCKAKPLEPLEPPISFVTGIGELRQYEDPHAVNTDGHCALFERKLSVFSFAYWRKLVFEKERK